MAEVVLRLEFSNIAELHYTIEAPHRWWRWTGMRFVMIVVADTARHRAWS